jgi:RNA polymerase sigma-70 factor (ECF subfamily)
MPGWAHQFRFSFHRAALSPLCQSPRAHAFDLHLPKKRQEFVLVSVNRQSNPCFPAYNGSSFHFFPKCLSEILGWRIPIWLAGMIDLRFGLTETTQSEIPLNRQQVQAVYEQYSEGLLHFLIGVLRDNAAAEDACQLTFMRLVEKGHLLQQPSAMKAWLYQVAFNEALLMKRRQATGQRHQESMAWYYQLCSQSKLPENGSIVSQGLIREENIEQIRQAIDELSDVQREVVRKRIYEGKKFRQIADELGVPLATVLSRMQMSLKKLKPVLQGRLNVED